MSAETVAAGVAAAFESTLPAILTAREVGASPALTWPAVHVTDYQVAQLVEFPAVEVIIRSDTHDGYESDDDGRPWDRVTYAMRIFLTVRGDDYQSTDLERKRLVAATKELLLSEAMPGALVAGSLRASYSEVGTDRNARTYAAGYVDVSLTVLERAHTPAVGADDIYVLQTHAHPYTLVAPGGVPDNDVFTDVSIPY